MLYTKPRVYIEDISVRTGLIGDIGVVKYIIEPAGLYEHEIPICRVSLLDAKDNLAVQEPAYGFSGTLKVPFPNLWWPRGMNSNPGYLYTLKVRIFLFPFPFPPTFSRSRINSREREKKLLRENIHIFFFQKNNRNIYSHFNFKINCHPSYNIPDSFLFYAMFMKRVNLDRSS